MEPELDKELNARKEEKKQLMALSSENTLKHIYNAEMAALTQKAEDLLIKPTYMPKVVVGVPKNPFKSAEDDGEIERISPIFPRVCFDSSLFVICICNRCHVGSIHRISNDF